MLETLFQLKRNNAIVWSELIAGSTTFIASLYIIVNPARIDSVDLFDYPRPDLELADVYSVKNRLRAFSGVAEKPYGL